MRRFTYAAAVVGVTLFGSSAAPALADCAADLKAVEHQAADTPQKPGLRVVEKFLQEAKEALAQGKKKKCKKKVALAKKRLERIPRM